MIAMMVTQYSSFFLDMEQKLLMKMVMKRMVTMNALSHVITLNMRILRMVLFQMMICLITLLVNYLAMYTWSP